MTHTLPLQVCPNLSAQDWDLLFNAVTLRLRRAIDHLQPPHQNPRVQHEVMESIDALERLHAMLSQERMARQQRERQARYRSLHDSLTALPNRRFFCDRLADLLDAPPGDAPVAVLYIDLDGFKPINDQHGHAAGDAVLQVVAARLAGAVRGDDVVGRLGGDEFACLLPGLSGHDTLQRLVCQMIDAVSAPVRIGALELTVRPSIGIALRPATPISAEDLIAHADAAMYRAKRSRSGHALFDPAIDRPTPAPAAPVLQGTVLLLPRLVRDGRSTASSA